MVNPPLPFETIDSINKISPPTLVQAKPVTTPATSLFSYLSRSKCDGPNTFSIISTEITVSYVSSIAIDLAA